MKDPNSFTRRNFFKSAGIGAAAVAGMPLLAHSCSPAEKVGKIHDFFDDGDVVLFQGDSITDAGRNKQQELPNNPWSFGVGYANHIGSWLLEEMPGKDLTIYNRGISGNKVFQLADRWEKDCLDLKLLICQPFILTGTSAVDESWVEPFSAYQAKAKKISDEFGAIWVPFQEAFDRAIEAAPPTYWTGDGVHPSMAGAQLMAKSWLEVLG